MNLKLLFWIFGVLAALGIFLLGASYGVELGVPSVLKVEKKIERLYSATMLINNGDTIKDYKITWTNNLAPNLFVATESVTNEHKIVFEFDSPTQSSYGAFIKQIGDKKNGTSKKYWQYWVNGVQPQVAADKYIVKSGDTVLWTFSESTF